MYSLTEVFLQTNARGGPGVGKDLLCSPLWRHHSKGSSFHPNDHVLGSHSEHANKPWILLTTVTPQPQTLPRTQYWTICQELSRSGCWEEKKRNCKELGNRKKGARDSPLGIHLTPGPTAPCSLGAPCPSCRPSPLPSSLYSCKPPTLTLPSSTPQNTYISLPLEVPRLPS